MARSGPHNSTNTGDNHKNNYKNIILEKRLFRTEEFFNNIIIVNEKGIL